MDNGGFSMGSAKLKADMALAEQKARTTEGFQTSLKKNAGQSPEESRRVADDFEAVFLTTMISQMFKGVKVNDRFGGGFGEEVWREHMFDEWGKRISKSGGVGISDQILRQVLTAQGKSQDEIARLMKETGAVMVQNAPRPSAATLAQAGLDGYAAQAKQTSAAPSTEAAQISDITEQQTGRNDMNTALLSQQGQGQTGTGYMAARSYARTAGPGQAPIPDRQSETGQIEDSQGLRGPLNRQYRSQTAERAPNTQEQQIYPDYTTFQQSEVRSSARAQTDKRQQDVWTDEDERAWQALERNQDDNQGRGARFEQPAESASGSADALDLAILQSWNARGRSGNRGQ